MTANPLKNQSANDERIAAQSPEEKRQFWIDRGNRILWGQEPTSKGDYLEPKTHLHWVCIEGNYFIEERVETQRRVEMARNRPFNPPKIGRAA